MSWAGHIARTVERIYIYIYIYMVLAEKPEGKKLLGRSRHRLENNIKVDLQEVGWGMDWIDLVRFGKDGGLV